MGGASRRAGAVVEEDMASVHLSISKHSQLSSLSTGGEVISFFFSPHPRHPLLISPPICFSSSLHSHLSTCNLLLHLSTLSFLKYFFQHSLALVLHPSLHPHLPPLLVASCALSGTVHSATKQSCLQHHTLANQAKPGCSSPQFHSAAPWYWPARRTWGISSQRWNKYAQDNTTPPPIRAIYCSHPSQSCICIKSKPCKGWRWQSNWLEALQVKMRWDGSTKRGQTGKGRKMMWWRKLSDSLSTTRLRFYNADETKQWSAAIVSWAEGVGFSRQHASLPSVKQRNSWPNNISKIAVV